MNIGLIGGLDRRESELTELARRAGHRLEWHSGHVTGRGADSLRGIVERSQVVVILTQVNSHGAMYLAKKLARQLGRETLVWRKCGTTRLEALLSALRAKANERMLSRCA
jgi:Uncharacterized protein conserved in bacteria (DUF2325)